MPVPENRSVPEKAGPKGKSGKKRRPPLWTTLLTVFGAVLVLTSVGTGVAAKYVLGQVSDSVETTDSVLAAGDGVGTEQTGELPDGAINLLMLGLDTRAGWEASGEGSRSDTIIVLHIPATRDKAEMISIPRDTYATIPADASLGFNGSTERINSAFYYGSRGKGGWKGGAKLAAKAVHQLTGISFNGVVIIDFAGFKDILEALGGVKMCVDQDVWSSHYVVNNGKVSYAEGADPEYPPKNALWFKKGCREMQPWEALEFSRIRHTTNGDYDRQRHQQQLLKAMVAKATSSGVMTSVPKVSKLLDAAGSSLKMDTNGVSIANFVFGLKGLAGTELVPIRSNGGSFVKAPGGAEGVSDDTRALFAAAAADKLDAYLIDHPKVFIDNGA
jgi:LCP family protein required for cell wall assembly